MTEKPKARRGTWWQARWSFAESCTCAPDDKLGMRCSAQWARCIGRANAFATDALARRKARTAP